MDKRFEEFPVNNNLFPGEHQHLKYVLTMFQLFLNNGAKEKELQQFVAPTLLAHVGQLRELLKESRIKMSIQVDAEKCNKLKGYLEYYGYDPHLFIH